MKREKGRERREKGGGPRGRKTNREKRIEKMEGIRTKRQEIRYMIKYATKEHIKEKCEA